MRPKLILSLPNCGSDWFATTLGRVMFWPYFHKEWFNPLTNQPMTDRLIDAGFGCESVSCYENIAETTPTADANSIFDKFVSDGYVLNKEVYGFAKAHWFSLLFDIVVLTRKQESLFPPSRLRVIHWYEAIGTAYGIEEGFRERVEGGYSIADKILRELPFPSIDYDDLGTIRDFDPLMATGWFTRNEAAEVGTELLRTRSQRKDPTS